MHLGLAAGRSRDPWCSGANQHGGSSLYIFDIDESHTQQPSRQVRSLGAGGPAHGTASIGSRGQGSLTTPNPLIAHDNHYGAPQDTSAKDAPQALHPRVA